MTIPGWGGHDSEPYPRLMQDEVALDLIQELMNGVVWTAATLDEIADLVRQTGREINDSGE